MLGRPKRKYRMLYTTYLDIEIVDWLRSRPRKETSAEFINNSLRKSMEQVTTIEKKTRLQELKAEMELKTAELCALEDEECKKQQSELLKQQAEAKYALEQREMQELQETLQFWRSQGPEYKTFLAKLEFEKKASLPLERLPRLRALKAELDRACADGEGRLLMDKMKMKLATPNNI